MTTRRLGLNGSSRSRSAGERYRYACRTMPTFSCPAALQALVDPQGGLDEGRLLHVDADELAETPAWATIRSTLRYAVSWSKDSPRCVSLSAMFARRPSGASRSTIASYSHDGRSRPGGVGDRLAEQCRVRVQTGVVQSPQHGNTLVERLSCDEAGRSEPHAVTVDDPAQQGLSAARRIAARESLENVDASTSSARDRAASARGRRTARPCGGGRRSRARRARR